MAEIDNSEVQDLLAECWASSRIFFRTVFPERFSIPFSPLHDQMIDAIESGVPRVAIAAPRGIGKTSLGIGIAAKRILFRDCNFLAYVGKSATYAEMQTENLKMDLATSEMVKKLWGPVKARNAVGIDETFSKKSWVASTGAFILPRGSGQQIRGALYGHHRPDVIIVDDLEDPDEIENDVLRLKNKLWFHADLMKAVSQSDEGWQVIYMDTLKHEDSLLQDLLDSPDWESLQLEICGDDEKSLAPDFKSDEAIAKEVEYHQKFGIMDVFYREFRSLPISTKDATFSKDYFRHYTETDEEFQKKILPGLETVALVDPAKTVKLHSAESAIVIVGISRYTSALYVRDVISSMMRPDELYDQIFNVVARYGIHAVGVEVTSLNEFITQPIRNEMSVRRQFFELIELKARGKKEGRIAALVPCYRQGYIIHNINCCHGLEAQLLSFPRSKRWDIMDALAYVIELLDIGERFFEPPLEDGEDEYKELEYEAPLEGWRLM